MDKGMITMNALLYKRALLEIDTIRLVYCSVMKGFMVEFLDETVSWHLETKEYERLLKLARSGLHYRNRELP